MEQQAFVLRIAPSGIDRLDEALAADQIIIGWSDAKGLLEPGLSWEQFREIVRTRYHAEDSTLRKAGAAAGHISRFIREMQVSDLVAVPYGSEFYVAQIEGVATHDPAKINDDTAYRRRVVWLNAKRPMSRSIARSALISRLKSQGTCTYATDLLPEIKECLQVAASGLTPTFRGDLQSRLIQHTLDEMRGGRMESFGFERLIREVLIGLGAEEARIVARSQDKGADIVATFLVAGTFRQVVAVQAKHWQPKPPVGKDVVEQLIKGIEAESADLGMVVTSGSISEEAVQAAEQYFVEKAVRIELVDGLLFAKLIVEHGIRLLK
jgi:predicted Mrr-cat superfamily restriction endonuclease